MNPFIAKDTPVSDEVLNAIAHLPTKSLSATVDPGFFRKLEDKALQLEQAERSLDVGRDAAGARASLEETLRDPAITPEQRDQAQLSLSRAIEACIHDCSRPGLRRLMPLRS